jgi:pyridoxamine 5'-phosphate oxidase
MEDLSNYRKSYDKNQLLETEIPNEPLSLFKQWFQEVEASNQIEEVNAMTVSSMGLDGYPKSRVVLLKKYDHEGFVFYTNYNSEKGKAIAANPNICISFFWDKFERQVIIKGIASKISDEQSDTYFASRPVGSQLGAIVSYQSEIIPSRAFLEEKLQLLEQQFENKSIPRPTNWGGFIIKPTEIEFWQGRPNRLHDRIRYKLQENSIWKIDRLSP